MRCEGLLLRYTRKPLMGFHFHYIVFSRIGAYSDDNLGKITGSHRCSSLYSPSPRRKLYCLGCCGLVKHFCRKDVSGKALSTALLGLLIR